MITCVWKGEEDLYRSLVRIESTVGKGSADLVDNAADWLVNDIRSSWSGSQQAIGSGNPPAIKTGNLDSSIQKEEQGRDLLGRFADTENTKVKFVRINTAEGNKPEGRGNYAQVLEDVYDLPFVQPAVDRLSGIYPEMAKRHIRL